MNIFILYAAILKQKPDSSREEISDRISKTVRTVQRALNSLKDKGYIKRVGSKQEPIWKILIDIPIQDIQKIF